MHFTGTKFALDSTVVEVQDMLNLHGSFLTNAVLSSYRNTIIKLTPYDETKKRAHNSKIARAKENLKLSHGGFSYRLASDTNPPIKSQRPSEPS